jgi:hypothetical protein
MAVSQRQRHYSGVRIFNWHYLSSPPQILRVPAVHLELGGLIYCVPYMAEGRHVTGSGTWFRNLLFWHLVLSQFYKYNIKFVAKGSIYDLGLWVSDIHT